MPSDAPAVTSDAPALAPPTDVETAMAAHRAFLDYSDGMLLLRAFNDNMVIVPSGRAHIDTYAFGGPGVAAFRRANGTGLVPNMFFRRFILEMGGVIRHDWSFWIGGNFAPTTIDANQAVTSPASVYDGFIAYEPGPWLKLHAGQYNIPVTMENVTSSRWLDFMERALIVRTIAAPYNKDLGFMAWGEIEKGFFEYQLGVFGGEGQNRMNVDDYVDGMGRVLVRPLASSTNASKRLHIGASGRYGWRHPAHVMYDAPTMSTPGGYAYWTPSYGSGAAETHIMPARDQVVGVGEVYVPFERFDIRGEATYVSEGRREALATSRNVVLRKGKLEGWGGYAQLSLWPLGTPRINGNPAGPYGRIRLPKDKGAEAPFGLQVVMRGEMVRLKYNSASEAGVAAGTSAITDHIDVNAFQVATNYWMTKHVRLTAEYSLYQFPGTPEGTVPTAAPPTNLAGAPGARGRASDQSASVLHEISFRVGLAL